MNDPSPPPVSAHPLPRSAASATAAGLGPLRHVATTGSTNTDLADEARSGDPSACVLVADHQTAGRGRLDRTWTDTPGRSLLVSVRFPLPPDPQDAAAYRVAAVGAGIRAGADAQTRWPVLVKWPNDLVVDDGPAPGKLAGVLAELVLGATPAVVVGFGVNLAPVPDEPRATSLAECGAVGDGADPRDAVLATMLSAIGERLDDPVRVRSELVAHSATLGRRVRVARIDAAPLEGIASSLTPEGHLEVVGDDGGHEIVTVGDVESLRTT